MKGAAHDRARALLTELRLKYTGLSRYRPLSLGIRAAVHAAVPGVRGMIVNCALARHCRCDNYLKALAAGGPRFGLDGAPSGQVSDEHQITAALGLARRGSKVRGSASALTGRSIPPHPAAGHLTSVGSGQGVAKRPLQWS